MRKIILLFILFIAVVDLKAQSTFFDLAPGGILTTTGTNYGGGANGRNFFAFTQLHVGESFTIDVGTSLPVYTITFGSWFAQDVSYIPVGYTIDHSNDASTWANDVTVTSNSSLNPTHTINQTARYWRLTITAVQSGQAYVSISGFELISSGLGAAIGTNLWSTPWVGTNIFTNSPVSIGTTTQAALLTLNSATGANMILQYSGANIAGLSVNNSSSTWNGGGGIGLNMVATNADINFQTGNPAATSMIIKNNGNVGMGTTNPLAKLDVENGTALVNTDALAALGGQVTISNNYGNQNGAVRLNLNNGGAVSWIKGIVTGPNTNTGSAMAFGVPANTADGTEAMRITSNGSLSIGTTDPKAYKLAVAGDAIAESMTVKLQGNWPDYTFKKEYRLMPLADLKTYVDKNRHLPEIPSAAQVAKDGINLGEMNRLLLKKMEELTLYLIEKDGQIKNQNAINEAQEKRMQRQEEELKKLSSQLQILIDTNKKNK